MARDPGQCMECGCRYHPGEMIVHVDGDAFHSDCYRTRGSYDVRPYEDQQPVELDLLLIALNNDGVSHAESYAESYADGDSYAEGESSM